METENNLGLGMSAWKGTDIEKGIHQDNLEKDLEKGFSETPEAKKEEGKPQPPSVAETHASEMEAKALKQKETAAMDKKHSYDKMDSSHQKAIRVLLNIEGKSAKEKIETVMEQFGVSKMGAINILADGTKSLPKPEQSEEEGGKEEKPAAKGEKASKDDLKKALDHTFDEIGVFDNDLEKAVPIGTVNKYGKIKTADGWVYQKSGRGANKNTVGTKESAGAKSLASPDITDSSEFKKLPSKVKDLYIKYKKGEATEESVRRKIATTIAQPKDRESAKKLLDVSRGKATDQSASEKMADAKARLSQVNAKLSGSKASMSEKHSLEQEKKALQKKAAGKATPKEGAVEKKTKPASGGNQDKVDHYTAMANDKNATPQKRSYARKQIAKYSASGQSGNPQNEKKPEAKKEEKPKASAIKEGDMVSRPGMEPAKVLKAGTLKELIDGGFDDGDFAQEGLDEGYLSETDQAVVIKVPKEQTGMSSDTTTVIPAGELSKEEPKSNDKNGDALAAKVKEQQAGTAGKIQSMMAKERKKEDNKKALTDLPKTIATGGMSFSLNNENGDNETFYEARGAERVDEDGDKVPVQSSIDAARKLAENLNKQGYKANWDYSEKGWVEVSVSK